METMLSSSYPRQGVFRTHDPFNHMEEEVALESKTKMETIMIMETSILVIMPIPMRFDQQQENIAYFRIIIAEIVTLPSGVVTDTRYTPF